MGKHPTVVLDNPRIGAVIVVITSQKPCQQNSNYFQVNILLKTQFQMFTRKDVIMMQNKKEWLPYFFLLCIVSLRSDKENRETLIYM